MTDSRELLARARERADAPPTPAEWGSRVALEEQESFCGRWRGETVDEDNDSRPIYLLWGEGGSSATRAHMWRSRARSSRPVPRSAIGLLSTGEQTTSRRRGQRASPLASSSSRARSRCRRQTRSRSDDKVTDELLDSCGRVAARRRFALSWTDSLDGPGAKACSRAGSANWKRAEPLPENEDAAAALFRERARRRNPVVVASASQLVLVGSTARRASSSESTACRCCR